jgi:hypothetical protein
LGENCNRTGGWIHGSQRHKPADMNTAFEEDAAQKSVIQIGCKTTSKRKGKGAQRIA